MSLGLGTEIRFRVQNLVRLARSGLGGGQSLLRTCWCWCARQIWNRGGLAVRDGRIGPFRFSVVVARRAASTRLGGRCAASLDARAHRRFLPLGETINTVHIQIRQFQCAVGRTGMAHFRRHRLNANNFVDVPPCSHVQMGAGLP